MKNFKVTNQIIKSAKKNVLSFTDLIPSIIASVFSVIFSLSIVVELSNFVDKLVFIFLAIFVVLFLIYNEKTKVTQLRLYFAGNKTTGRYFLIAFTFFMSFSLSGIGIYYWTNKTTELTDNTNVNNKTEIAQINESINRQIDSVNNISIENNVNYVNAVENLNFWKTRRAANLEERAYIREQIENTQSNVNNVISEFNANKAHKIELIEQNRVNKIEVLKASFVKSNNNISKNNILSYIFFALVGITEFVIIILSKEIALRKNEQSKIFNGNIAKEFKLFYDIMFSVYTTKKLRKVKTEDNKIKTLHPYLAINDIKYNPITTNNNTDWDQVKKLFNVLIALRIISPKGYIQVDENKALNRLSEYYNRIIQNY